MLRKLLCLVSLLTLLVGRAQAQLTAFFVPPVLTNAGYATTDDSNFVALNPGVATNNKLLVYLCGTNGKTTGATYFATQAANLGYHALVVAYRNYPTVGSVCAASADSLCYDKYRQQVCFGTPVSTAGIDSLHAIATRTRYLLLYLNATYPAAGWGQFIVGGQPAWNKTAVSGHSQGSGHAMYLAKKLACERAILFSGPDDVNTYYQRLAHWVRVPGLTPAGHIYTFDHLRNEGVPFSVLLLAARTLGLTVAAGNDTVDVDHAAPPYRSSHVLYTNAPPQRPGTDQFHESPVVNFYTPLVPGTSTPLFQPVWAYMLTDVGRALALAAPAAPAGALTAYPVPATGTLTVALPAASATQPALLRAYSASGQLVLTQAAIPVAGQLQVPLAGLAPGLYLLLVQQADAVQRCPFVVGGQ